MVEKDIDEVKLLEYKYNKRYHTDKVLGLTLLLTERCNFACPYCYECKTQQAMNDENKGLLLNWLSDTAKKRDMVSINFFGGEPLLEWEFSKVIMDRLNAESKSFSFKTSYQITTNGYLMNDDVCNEIVNKYKMRGCQLTIDGCKRTHDATRKLGGKEPTFDTVMANIKNLSSYYTKSYEPDEFLLRINLLNNTVAEIEDMLSVFSDTEKKNIRIYFRAVYNTRRFCEENRNRDELASFFLLAKKMKFKIAYKDITEVYCEGALGENQLHIKPDLSIWKCNHDESFDGANIGRINKELGLCIDENKLAKWSLNNPFSSQKCRSCNLLPLCYGACPLEYAITGQRTCLYEKKIDIVDVLTNQKERMVEYETCSSKA